MVNKRPLVVGVVDDKTTRTTHRFQETFDDEDADEQALFKKFKEGGLSLKGQHWIQVQGELGTVNKETKYKTGSKAFKIIFNEGAAQEGDSATYLAAGASALAMAMAALF